MTIEVKRVDKGFQLHSSNGSEGLYIGVHPKFQEDTKGMRPMELLLSGIGSCLSIDLLNILYKQKQDPEDFKIKLNGLRDSEPPNAFTEIEILATCSGDVSASKLMTGMEVVVDKYCSVIHSLHSSIAIRVSYQLNGKEKVSVR